MKQSDIDLFVRKHSKWIDKHFTTAKERYSGDGYKDLSMDEINSLKSDALLYIPEKVKYYSELMGVVPTGIKITSAKTRWGSCSAKNSLCVSYRLMLYPKEAIDYVIVHEFAHIRVKNHSVMFYNEIKKYMPDYKDRIRMLNT